MNKRIKKIALNCNIEYGGHIINNLHRFRCQEHHNDMVFEEIESTEVDNLSTQGVLILVASERYFALHTFDYTEFLEQVN